MANGRLSKSQKEIFLARCVASVKRNQGRMTLARQMLFETLASADEPLGAYDVYERTRKQTCRIDVTTVYRNLEFLASEGLIHEFGHEGWIACSHLETTCGSLHVLLRCQFCSYMEETCIVNTDQFSKSLLSAKPKRNLRPSAAVIIGTCESCLVRKPKAIR